MNVAGFLKSLLFVLAFAVKKAIEVAYKCKRPVIKAYESLKSLKYKLLRRLKKQLTNAKLGQKKSSYSRIVYRALRSIAKPGGKSIAAVEKAFGCMAKQYGYKAYSISGEFGVGMYLHS